MTTTHLSSRLLPQEPRRRTSDSSISNRSTYSSDTSSSTPPSPTHEPPSPSLRAIHIRTALKRVRNRSSSLRAALSEAPSEVTFATRIRITEFQKAFDVLFNELLHLPDDVPPTPALITAMIGCSFQVNCFALSAEMWPHVGGDRLGRQIELLATLETVMVSICELPGKAAGAIEEAELERKRLEDSVEFDSTKAERDFGSRVGSFADDRRMSWFVRAGLGNFGFNSLDPKRNAPLTEHLKNAPLTNTSKSHLPSPPPSPNQPVFSRKEALIPRKRPSKGRYDIDYLRKSVCASLPEDNSPPLRDSLAIINVLAPFPNDLPKPDLNDPEVSYIEYNPDGSIKKANLRGLVKLITSGSAVEHEEFVSMVLMTFRLFASGRDLADALCFRYTEQCPEWLERKGVLRYKWDTAQKRMRLRVATVLHLWMELHWKPEDSDAIPRLQELVEIMEGDRAFHARSLRLSLDRIVEEKEHYHGQRFRKEERYKPTTVPPPPTPFASKKNLAALVTKDPTALETVRFATPEGVVEFARMITMVESTYYRKLSPENFVHYNSEQTQNIRRELGDFEQRYKTWIVWTITNPRIPAERAEVIRFWFDVAKACVQYRNFNTAYQITRVLGDPEFEKMRITREVLEQLDKTAIYEFWEVCRLFEKETWWSEMNSNSLPAIPVSHILIRWRIYIEECGLRGLYKRCRDFSLPEFKSEGRIDVSSFLNLADLIWDIERTYEPHTFVRVPWIEKWFLDQVFSPKITDFGLETQHFKTGVAKDNPTLAVPESISAKLVAMLEAKLRRKGKKKVELTPLVPTRKLPVEAAAKKAPAKLKKRPPELTLHSHSSQPSLSRPGTPNSQNSDTQVRRQPNKLRKRSHSFNKSSPESIQQSLPVQQPPSPPAQVQPAMAGDRERGMVSPSEIPLLRVVSRVWLGPPPSPSHGRRFGDVSPRSQEKVPRTGLLQVCPPSPSTRRRTKPPQRMV